MRLIDADTLADALFDKRKNYPQWVADTIGNMPEAVVRCKDCKFHHASEKLNLCWCEKDFIEGLHSRDWYCADGERWIGEANEID